MMSEEAINQLRTVISERKNEEQVLPPVEKKKRTVRTHERRVIHNSVQRVHHGPLMHVALFGNEFLVHYSGYITRVPIKTFIGIFYDSDHQASCIEYEYDGSVYQVLIPIEQQEHAERFAEVFAQTLESLPPSIEMKPITEAVPSMGVMHRRVSRDRVVSLDDSYKEEKKEVSFKEFRKVEERAAPVPQVDENEDDVTWEPDEISSKTKIFERFKLDRRLRVGVAAAGIVLLGALSAMLWWPHTEKSSPVMTSSQAPSVPSVQQKHSVPPAADEEWTPK